MKTREAVLRKGGEPWELTELDLDEPQAGEVLIRMEAAGDIKLSELVTQRYTLDEVNEGYQDMMDGKNIRGVIIHEH
jgi:Zn-dependent alcohol dehydrogenase